MYRIFLALGILFSATSAAQYKNDNVLFTTVDPDQLCALMQQHKEYLLLDVRSKGEYFDTSASLGLNIGHLRGAMNIDIRELPGRLAEIREYRDRPVFVYCSHSQRSRRAGKILADSGFAKVFNINGGLTALYNQPAAHCAGKLIESNNAFRVISAVELCGKLSRTDQVFLLDVRPDSAFRQISLDPQANAIGYLKGTVHIPLGELSARLSQVPRGKEIIITDLYGVDAGKAATLLHQQGYSNLHVVLEGINKLLMADEREMGCRTRIVGGARYQLLNPKDFARLSRSGKSFFLLDVRKAEEFNNQSPQSFRNVGRLRGAVNIPLSALADRLGELKRDQQIVIYVFGGGTESYAAAQLLVEHGFSDVAVLNGGMYNIRWMAANDRSYAFLNELVVDVPEANR